METVNPESVYESSAPNSRAVVHGDIVYVSGVVGIDSETGEYGETMADQTLFAFENIKATLEEAGSSLDQMLRLLIFFSDPKEKAEMDEVYREYVKEPYPARAALATDFDGEAKIEIVVTAYR